MLQTTRVANANAIVRHRGHQASAPEGSGETLSLDLPVTRASLVNQDPPDTQDSLAGQGVFLGRFNMTTLAPHSTDATRAASGSAPLWQQRLREGVRDVWELARLLELPEAWGTAAQAALEAQSGAVDFPLRVPRGFVNRMRRGDPTDPLLRQVLPVAEESLVVPGFQSDPVGDQAAQVIPGLLHKYAGRTLIVATGACAVHCRYCFRREYPYGDGPAARTDWEPVFEHLAADPSIDEVLLSGGDPLSLADSKLAWMVGRLAEIPHLKRLRVHTRLPIVLPERVVPELIDWLRGTRLTPIFVVHANHPREIDDEVARALSRLVDAGIPLLNQAVLLRGINDDAAVLIELCRRLVDLRVMPYYLHQLDRVHGTAHFEVDDLQGLALIDTLREALPGYAVPRFVRETAGERSKLPIATP